jgi:hypothetical protein
MACQHFHHYPCGAIPEPRACNATSPLASADAFW